jgi:hypothetical protein
MQPFEQSRQIVSANTDQSRVDHQDIDIAAAHACQGDRGIPQPLHGRRRLALENASADLFGPALVTADYQDANAVTHWPSLENCLPRL